MKSVRLTEETERKVKTIAKIEGKTESEIIRIALQDWLEKHSAKKTAYELGKDVFGKYGSAHPINSSAERKNIIREAIREKNNRRFKHSRRAV